MHIYYLIFFSMTFISLILTISSKSYKQARTVFGGGGGGGGAKTLDALFPDVKAATPTQPVTQNVGQSSQSTGEALTLMMLGNKQNQPQQQSTSTAQTNTLGASNPQTAGAPVNKLSNNSMLSAVQPQTKSLLGA